MTWGAWRYSSIHSNQRSRGYVAPRFPPDILEIRKNSFPLLGIKPQFAGRPSLADYAEPVSCIQSRISTVGITVLYTLDGAVIEIRGAFKF